MVKCFSIKIQLGVCLLDHVDVASWSTWDLNEKLAFVAQVHIDVMTALLL